MIPALASWLIAALVAWSPSTSCDDLRADNLRLETENRALRQMAGKRWPGSVSQ